MLDQKTGDQKRCIYLKGVIPRYELSRSLLSYSLCPTTCEGQVLASYLVAALPIKLSFRIWGRSCGKTS